VLVASRGPTTSFPEVGFEPFAGHAPDAEQLFVFVDVQESVEVSPLPTVSGVASNVSVGAGVELTVTVTERLMLPPAPEHPSVKVLVAPSAPVACEPDVDFVPDHALDAVQLVAFVDDQFSVDACPCVTVVGVALNESVGAGATVTVTESLALPPAPEQVSEYERVEFIGPLGWFPVVDFVPDHAPDAVQLVAFVDDHAISELSPDAMVVGLALNETVGAGGGGGVPCTDTMAVSEALPPVPVHASEKLLVVVSAPVDMLPDVSRLPDHAPDAVHDVASVVDQLNVEALPWLTDCGLAFSVTVGMGAVPGLAGTSDGGVSAC